MAKPAEVKTFEEVPPASGRGIRGVNITDLHMLRAGAPGRRSQHMSDEGQSFGGTSAAPPSLIQQRQNPANDRQTGVTE